MGVRVSKVSERKYVAQATFKIEEVPNERPKSPILNHNILAGRTSSKSTILDEVPMLEGSLRKEEPEEGSEPELSPTEQSGQSQETRLFVYSDCMLDPEALFREANSALLVAPRGGRLLDADSFMLGASAVAALTMPLMIRNKLAHKIAGPKAARLQFDFSDFQVFLTEEELDQEIISRAGANIKNITLHHLMEAKRNKVAKIYNYHIQTLLGRSGRIKCLKLSPDEKKMVYCSNDETILVLYDLVTGQELLHFDGHSDQIMSACFSPDGKYVCSGSRDETIIRWDTSTAKQVQVMCHDSMVMCCDYSRDGHYIVAGCQDKICKLWDARTGKKALCFTLHTALIVAVAFSPDSFSVCSASADRTLMIWDVRTGKRKYTLTGHTGVVLSCAYSPDNLRIVSNDEKTLRVWNARDGKLLKTWGMDARVPSRTSAMLMPSKRPEMKYILCTFAPGSHIIASINNKVVQVLDPNTGEEILSFFFKASVACVSAGNFNTLALGDANGNVHVVHLELETDIMTLPKSAFKNFQVSPTDED
jgi:WD40 repeat protein